MSVQFVAKLAEPYSYRLTWMFVLGMSINSGELRTPASTNVGEHRPGTEQQVLPAVLNPTSIKYTGSLESS